MVSITPNTLREIAVAAAFDSGRPWRVADLLERAEGEFRTIERRVTSLGLSAEQAATLARRSIYERILKAGNEMDALPPDQSKPTPQQIETALEAFTTKQWTPVEQWPPLVLSPPMEGEPVVEARYGLMESVGRAEVETLLSYLRQNSGDLKQRFGARKVEAIEGRAIERSTELWLAENRDKLVPDSDVHWAVAFRRMFLEANVKGKGHTTKDQPMAERARPPYIARLLTKRDEQTGREMKVTPYMVNRWYERMEKQPFEQYAADKTAKEVESGAALIDYWTMIRKPYQRKH